MRMYGWRTRSSPLQPTAAVARGAASAALARRPADLKRVARDVAAAGEVPSWSERLRPLQPWSPCGRILTRKQSVPFTPVVQRLNVPTGPLRDDARSGAGEPDGFHGITRRG